MRARLRLRSALAGLVAVATVAALLVLLALPLPLGGRHTRTLRSAYLLLGTSALVAAAALALGRTLGRRGDGEIAALVERSPAGSALGDSLRTALELRRDPVGFHGASPALVDLHVVETAEAVRAVDARDVVPLEPLRRPLVALLVLALGLVAFQVVAPQRLTRFVAWLREASPAGDFRGVEAGVEVPVAGALLADLRVTYRYPAYTGLGERQVPGSSGDLRAIRGTEVVFQATATKPVSAGRLALDAGEPVPIVVGPDGRSLAGKLTLLRSATYAAELTATGAGGEVQRDPVTHALVVDDDATPEVSLAAPAADLELDEMEPLDLAWSAKDDFGLTALELVVGRDGREERVPLERGAADPETHEVRGAYRFTPRTPLAPGDEVAIRIEALDNDTVSGPKKGVSATRHVRIRSAADAHAETVAALEKLLGEEVETLAQALTAPSITGLDSRKLEAVFEAEAAIGRRLKTHVEAIDTILRTLWSDPLATERTYQALSEVRLRLDRLEAEKAAVSGRATIADGVERAHAAFDRPVADLGLVREVRELRPRETTELEAAALSLDELVDREKADEMKRMADSVLADQKRLAELLERYRKTKDEALKGEIERLVARMEARLAELESKVAESARAGTPMEEFVNMDALRNELGPDAQDSLQALKESLAKGDLDEAARRADALTASLSRTMAALERGTHGAMALSDARRADAMGAAAERLDALATAQGKLAEGTDEVRRDLEGERIGAGKDPGALFERARKKALEAEAAARKATEALDADPELKHRRADEQRLAELTRDLNERLFRGGDLSDLESSRRELFHLRDALSSTELRDRLSARDALDQGATLGDRAAQALAARSLEGAIRSAEPLASMVAEAAELLPSSAEAAKARDLGAELLRDLESLDRLFGKPLGDDARPADAERMSELARKQRSLRSEAGEVGEELAKMGEETPGLPPEVNTGLGEAAESMEGAEQSLAGRDVEGGTRNARSAKQRLDEALESLKQAQARAQQQGGEGGGTGGGLGGLAYVPPGVSGAPRFRDRREGPDGSRPGDARLASGSAADKVAIPGADASLAPDAFRKDVLEGMKEPRPPGYEDVLERYYRRLVR